MASKKDDEISLLNSFYNNKTTILQEARVFNESPVSPRKCRQLLTRIVYLFYTGETFVPLEATPLFFGITKLFVNKDVRGMGLGDALGTPTDVSASKFASTGSAAADGLRGDQGALDGCRRCNHDHEQYSARHAA